MKRCTAKTCLLPIGFFTCQWIYCDSPRLGNARYDPRTRHVSGLLCIILGIRHPLGLLADVSVALANWSEFTKEEG